MKPAVAPCLKRGNGFVPGLGMQVLSRRRKKSSTADWVKPLDAGQIADRPSWFFMILRAGSPAVILVEKECLLAGELDLLGSGGGAVAKSRTITPGADRNQNGTVFGRTSALEDKSGVHPAIGADDEADANLGARVGNVEQRIRSG